MKTSIFKLLTLSLFAYPLVIQAQYQVLSIAGAEPNQTIVTRYDKGYIVKSSGERMEGDIQLKVKKNDTLEVRFKGENGKEVYKREGIKSFGLLKTVADYRVDKIESKNFHPGYILLKDGEKLTGRIAVRNLTDADFSFHFPSVLFEKADKYVSIIPASKINMAEQTINGKAIVYENYKDGILKHAVEGKIIVMRNPFPTTERTGLNNLVNQAADSVAKEMAEKSLERNLEGAIGGDADAQDRISEDLENAEELSRTDAKFMQNEYLIKSGNGNITIIKPDNFDRWAGGLKVNCPALAARKDLTKYNKIYDMVRFYNSSCN